VCAALDKAYDCKEGCSLTAHLVCGEDGLTYAGACLAHCQGVGVEHDGPCSVDSYNIHTVLDLEAIGPSSSEEALAPAGRTLSQVGAHSGGKVSASVLTRFRDEGFK
jgi:hypothetical protein